MADKKEIILFAEDDLSTSKVLLYMLTRDGYQVFPYNNGVGVIDGVREHRPDLILLDIMMPVKDGLTVLKEIREDPSIAETPVILLTAAKDENSVNKSIEYGAADFLLKPFKINDLSIRIRKLIEISQNKKKQSQVKQLTDDHFRKIIDTIPVLIWESGIDRKFTFLNKPFLDFTGRTAEQETGNVWIESIHKEDAKEFLETYYSAFEKRQPFKMEYRLRNNSGEFRSILNNGSPRYSSEGIFLGYIGSGIDITDQKANYIAVKEELDQKKQINNQLASSKEKAEELNRLKSNFLSNMSHELRTPLVGILGFTEILRSELNNSVYSPMIDGLFKSGKRLSDTLNALLDLSDTEARKVEVNLVKTDITGIVENLVIPFYPVAKSKKLTLKLVINNTGNFANLDINLLTPVFNNLLNNAIKFTKQGGVIVEVGKKTLDGKTVIILAISDTGIGILPESMKLIFEDFRQESEGIGRKYEGTGLGLTLSKKFTELMHGTITVKSEYGSGSSFSVVFPAI